MRYLKPKSIRKAKKAREAGAALVEMGLLIALIAVVCFIAVKRSGRATGCKLVLIDAALKVTGSAPNYSYTSPSGAVTWPMMPSIPTLLNSVNASCLAMTDDEYGINWLSS